MDESIVSIMKKEGLKNKPKRNLLKRVFKMLFTEYDKEKEIEDSKTARKRRKKTH